MFAAVVVVVVCAENTSFPRYKVYYKGKKHSKISQSIFFKNVAWAINCASVSMPYVTCYTLHADHAKQIILSLYRRIANLKAIYPRRVIISYFNSYIVVVPIATCLAIFLLSS